MAKTKQLKISTILNRAADNHLWNGDGWYHWNDYNLNRKYSCEAILCAEGLWDEATCNNLSWSTSCKKSKAIQFVKELGVKVGSSSQFDNFDNEEEAQQARYAWLKFAAMYAKEQGL